MTQGRSDASAKSRKAFIRARYRAMREIARANPKQFKEILDKELEKEDDYKPAWRRH